MKDLIDRIILHQLGHDPQTWPMTQGLYLVMMMVVGAALTTFGAIFAGLLSWWERRLAARIQSRVGPNRVGPQGILQFAADALKLILKEDLIPADSDHILFRIAPYFVMIGFILTFVVLPFGYRLSPTNMNVGLFYVVSITALVVVGILVSGWASNSKWSLFGGIRAAAQVVSYEIPAGMAILVPILMSGSLNMHDIIRAQGGAPWDWFMFQTPWGYAAFFILFVAMLAEGNRTPFDLPEAESEIVAGYNTEYSGMRFGYFFLAEWGNLWVMSAVLSTLFLGGWQVPFVSMARLTSWEAAGHVPVWFYAASALVFIAKVLVLIAHPRGPDDESLLEVPGADRIGSGDPRRDHRAALVSMVRRSRQRASRGRIDSRHAAFRVLPDRRVGSIRRLRPQDAAQHLSGRRPRRPDQLVAHGED